MNGIRAFVGHSFTSDDSAVLTQFLKYCELLTRSNINFSWAHAEPAEPRVLADKVISLLSDCNVLIAICTRKERVVAPAALTDTIFPRGSLKAAKREFMWKTSDWIIQEIGLAIGRDLNLIILLESGVKKPYGLQGDMEYISFERDYPARSFPKILEMINAISPEKPGVAAVPLDTRSPPGVTSKEPEPATGDDWWTPKPDWTRLRYEVAIRLAIDFEYDDKRSAIDRAYLSTEHAAQGDNKQSWEAFSEYIRLLCNKVGSLANLKALAAEHPDSPGTLEQLAKGFAWYDNHFEAARTFEAAAAKSSNDAQTICLMGRAAKQYARATAPTTVFEVVHRMKLRAGATVDRELQVLHALCELAEIANEQEATIALMERIVEIDPDDHGTRFNVAYKHSERGNNDLALFHYLKIPQPTRDGSAWNNLGVSFQHVGLPASAVGAYRRAELLGNTLAMSNLAQKLMSVGFLSEAQERCENALKIEDCHRNAASTLAQVKGIPDEEHKKQAQALEKARPISEFYRECGRAMSQLEPSEIATDWRGPDCDLRAALDGGMLKAVGSYERTGFAGLLSPFVPFSRPSEPDRFRVEYKGIFRGRA